LSLPPPTPPSPRHSNSPTNFPPNHTPSSSISPFRRSRQRRQQPKWTGPMVKALRTRFRLRSAGGVLRCLPSQQTPPGVLHTAAGAAVLSIVVMVLRCWTAVAPFFRRALGEALRPFGRPGYDRRNKKRTRPRCGSRQYMRTTTTALPFCPPRWHNASSPSMKGRRYFLPEQHEPPNVGPVSRLGSGLLQWPMFWRASKRENCSGPPTSLNANGKRQGSVGRIRDRAHRFPAALRVRLKPATLTRRVQSDGLTAIRSNFPNGGGI